MRHKNGFTVIEISFALVIIGIISAYTIVRLNTFSSYHKAEKLVWVLFKELSSLKTIAMKNDCTVRVNFTATSYTVLEDLNNNGTADAGETSKTKTLPSDIAFGLPTQQPPTIAPVDATLPANGAFLSGNWNAQGIWVNNSASAITNTGGIFLKSPNLKKFTFCIAVTANAQIFKMYKWDGSRWIDLR
jgi:prepilin-type N-terminal cleavage/methylation domain-containing protein